MGWRLIIAFYFVFSAKAKKTILYGYGYSMSDKKLAQQLMKGK